jgi:hypothetical protein
MQHHTAHVAARTAALLLLALQARAGTGEAVPSAEALCRDWCGPAAQLAPLAPSQTNALVREVVLDGRPSGWLFRTDQVPPACKGKRGEIVLLVAIGTDTRIKGIQVLSHKEDPPYFKRIKHEFFDQFINRRAADDEVKIDAVTRATLSSRAIIREVLEGAKNVVALPEVAGKVSTGEQCSLTKTPVVSHN